MKLPHPRKFTRKNPNMKLFIASALVLGAFSLAAVGCVDKSSTTKETDVSTPGTTTPVSDQQQRMYDTHQQGGSTVRVQTGTTRPKQDNSKEEKRSVTDSQQQGASKSQQQVGSKEQKQNESNGRQQSAPQSQPKDDSRKKESK
jgi:hypothetical protein